MKSSKSLQSRRYQVLILPHCEVAQEGCTLREAEAYIATYDSVMKEPKTRAVIAIEPPCGKSRALHARHRACVPIPVASAV